MPNHVTNILTIVSNSEDKLKEVLEYIKDNNEGIGSIDFNKITKMPDWVFQENLSSEDEEKYGKENCWYGWSIKNWGTKWNAYDFEKGKNNEVIFHTAWDDVFELMYKLSLIFKYVSFYYSWANEDFGAHQGEVLIKNGEVIYQFIPPFFSKYAYELGCNILGIEPNEYNMYVNPNTGNYEYFEEEIGNSKEFIDPIFFINNQ